MVAQTIQAPFDLSQPAGQILAVVLFLIPGLNCTWIIERLAGRTPLSGTERPLRAIAWSLFLYAVASPWLIRLGDRVPEAGTSGRGNRSSASRSSNSLLPWCSALRSC